MNSLSDRIHTSQLFSHSSHTIRTLFARSHTIRTVAHYSRGRTLFARSHTIRTLFARFTHYSRHRHTKFAHYSHQFAPRSHYSRGEGEPVRSVRTQFTQYSQSSHVFVNVRYVHSSVVLRYTYPPPPSLMSCMNNDEAAFWG